MAQHPSHTRAITIASIALLVLCANSWGGDSASFTPTATGIDTTKNILLPVNTGGTGSNSPAAMGREFKLISGVFDPNAGSATANFDPNNTSSTAPSTTYTYGGWASGCDASYCFIRVTPPATSKCPSGFKPLATVTFLGGMSVPGGLTTACIGQQTAPDNTNGIAFSAVVNSIPSNATNTALYSNGYRPGSSFQWEVSCYPQNAKFPPVAGNAGTLTYGAEGGPQSGKGYCNAPLAYQTYANPILFWDAGYIQSLPVSTANPAAQNYQGRSQVEYKYFVTNRQCPAGYKPYISMKANATIGQDNINSYYTNTQRDISGNIDIVAQHSICVARINSTTSYTVYDRTRCNASHNGNLVATNYCVSYVPQSQYLNLSYDATKLTVSDVTQNADLRGISWEMYCYPPGIAPPTNLLDNTDTVCTW